MDFIIWYIVSNVVLVSRSLRKIASFISSESSEKDKHSSTSDGDASLTISCSTSQNDSDGIAEDRYIRKSLHVCV